MTNPPSAGPLIELRHAAVGYDDRPTIRDVDLRIDRGEVVALVGPNGAGKTTLVRGILGLARVLDGELLLFGVPAQRFRERHRIGYVPQRHTVGGAIPSSVQEVVSSGRLARRPAWSRATATDRRAVDRAIETVGLGELRDCPVSILSGGQQRRTLIARALASEPEILVMDEPTAGVDAANQANLARTLADLVTAGMTLLVVTHEIGPLLPVLTRVVVVEAGRIAADRARETAPGDMSASGELLLPQTGPVLAGSGGRPSGPARGVEGAEL
ncbi:MAG TPA: metal ABC transporter ATP-binding protein [Kineosporiaceae bacterium]|nr:metal ABC transporter ATP-binding protein [Kineosporiaceae bacterium]